LKSGLFLKVFFTLRQQAYGKEEKLALFNQAFEIKMFFNLV